MSDPYFQRLFADRIGGANYGKGSEIYKFEKIKRAKRKALAEHPERKLVDFGIGENDDMAARQRAPRDGCRDRQAGEPRLRRQRHRRLQGGRRPFHATRVPGGTRSRQAKSITASARKRPWPCCPRPSSTRAT